uniref:Uncharacterized protein n=1 Tax=Micrurus surinamensis TaxID=129470 RepID=A0A2D4NQ63_MICSU
MGVMGSNFHSENIHSIIKLNVWERSVPKRVESSSNVPRKPQRPARDARRWAIFILWHRKARFQKLRCFFTADAGGCVPRHGESSHRLSRGVGEFCLRQHLGISQSSPVFPACQRSGHPRRHPCNRRQS